MPSEDVEITLRDILRHIDLAEDFAHGCTWDHFRSDLKTVYAVTRCLEVISEASRRLPAELKLRHSTISWRQMAAAGNIYRHEYEDVAERFVWSALRNSLPPLRAVVEVELSRS